MIPSPPSPLPVAVLGAGIAGLTAAWRLRAAGREVVVLEAASRVGGSIESVRTGEWLHETGPNSILLSDPADAEMIEAVGLGSRRRDASKAARRRYIVRRGHLEPMPSKPADLLRTPLFSGRAKLALAGELFRSRGPEGDTESVAAFTKRRLGREFLDYAIDPLVAGIYAGDPHRLSVRYAFPKLHALEQRHGSLLRGALRKRNTSGGPAGKMISFVAGLEEFPRALAATLDGAIHLGARVGSASRDGNVWRLSYVQGGRRFELKAAAILSALPAAALAEMDLGVPRAPEGRPLAPAAEIEHPPVASVFLGFRREDVAHPLDGFGFLVPRSEQRSILGTLFSSTLFPGRAPEGHVALTTFVGGSRQPAIAHLEDNVLVRLVRGELAAFLGVRGGPVFVSIRRHARAIPQYNLGYARFLDAFAAAEAAAPGFYIGGNARDGISLSSCLASGRRLAAAALALP